MSQKTRTSPLIVVVGETASGKSRLALNLAKRLDGEIICADSWTVRKEVNIGTDKPSYEERREIAHHLLDIVPPCADFTAAVFKDLALKAIEDIAERGKIPIMVGGSGLYVDSVIFDYNFLDAGNRDKRRELNGLSIEDLQRYIEDKGLIISRDIDIRNKRRLIRFIESEGAKPTKGGLRPRTLLIGLKLEPTYHKELIGKRVDAMLVSGLESEVRQLSQKYGWQCEALKGVGYKQWRGYLEGSRTIEETRADIVSATNNLAKKQRTWFKRNKSIHWLLQPVNLDQVVDLVTTELAI